MLQLRDHVCFFVALTQATREFVERVINDGRTEDARRGHSTGLELRELVRDSGRSSP